MRKLILKLFENEHNVTIEIKKMKLLPKSDDIFRLLESKINERKRYEEMIEIFFKSINM